jgi:hypothetical protein
MEGVMEPLRLFPVIALVSIPTVMYGGHALLGFLVRGGLSEHQQTYFRAGHAHAGVLLILTLVYFEYLGRAHFGEAAEWALGVAMVVGVLAQSGGFFLHMGLGAPGRGSIGMSVTRAGAALLAVAMLVLAYGLIVVA